MSSELISIAPTFNTAGTGYRIDTVCRVEKVKRETDPERDRIRRMQTEASQEELSVVVCLEI